MQLIKQNIGWIFLFTGLFLMGAADLQGVTAIGMYGWNGTNQREVWLDKTTRTIPTIDYEHYEIHQGNGFSASYYATVASGNTAEFIMVTPDTTAWVHLIWELQGTLITTIDMYESATTSDNGTEITSYNRNRNSLTTTGAHIYHTPTLTGDGTLIYTEKFGVSTGAQVRIGGKSRATQEMILKRNTKYLVRVTSGTNANVISIRVRWYDMINKAS